MFRVFLKNLALLENHTLGTSYSKTSTTLLDLKLWQQGVLMSTPCCQSLRSNWSVVSEYEVPKLWFPKSIKFILKHPVQTGDSQYNKDVNTTKRRSFSQHCMCKRRSFVHTLLCKRPSFFHTMLGKRRCIAPTLLTKLPSFSQQCMGKRRWYVVFSTMYDRYKTERLFSTQEAGGVYKSLLVINDDIRNYRMP